MTTTNANYGERKKSKLRFNEYYNTQELFDKLYERSKKGHKFKNLLEIIASRENILLAYRTIKKNTGSKTKGVNNTTIEDIAEWGTNKLVNYVRNRLNYYVPQPVRRVYIPKPDGRKRPLGIPTMEDRIIQQCIKQVLEPICEAKFHKHSYGFRSNRSTKHAIARCMYLANSSFHYTVDVDIKGFFDNVDQGKLLKQLWSLGIQDKNLISILSRLLKAEIKGEGKPSKGTPQGGIISPLLANVVLNELDWWISNQWETFRTKKKYSNQGSRITSQKQLTKLKQMFMVRYADDFKIFCKDYETASKTKIAVSRWLKERLNLEISENKTKITNLKSNYSKFLGIKFKAVKKGNKYVCKSRIIDKTKKKIAYKLKQQIKEIRKHANVKQVNKLNAMILGMHNYYSMATHVNIDFSEIAFQVNRTLENRLRECMKESEKGYKSKTYQKLYGKYNYKPYCVAGVRIFPIGGVTTKPPMNFSPDICDYTEKGREKIHKKLHNVYPPTLQYLMKNPVRGQSIEYNDNRISRYAGQNGCCYVTDEPLVIGDIECHHKKPRSMGGKDSYRNLVLVTGAVHKLIHATNKETIEKCLNKIDRFYLDEKALSKLNKLRSKVGNDCIELD